MSGSRISREIRLALLLCSCAAVAPRALLALDPHRSIGQYVVTRWGSHESFPGGPVNAIAQTPDGYLWIGAENGLVRFDGISFRLLEHENTPSLPAGHVLGLIVDSEGALWVRMESPYLMRYRGGTFEQIYPVPLPEPFAPARERGATAVTRGTRGDVLIAPPDAPLRYSAGKLSTIVSSGAAGGLAISIAETADGTVWVGMRDTGLFCVREGHGSQVNGLPDQKVNVLLPGAGPELWIGTDSGLMRWDGSAVTRRGVPAALARSPILALARDRDSNLWVSAPAGVTRIDSSGSTTPWTGESLPGVLHAIFEDREGNLWFGGTEGLMQLRDTPFLSYTGLAGEGGSLYVDSSGRAWTGLSSGRLLWIRGAEHHSITLQGMDRDVIYSISGGPGDIWVGRRLGGITQLREEDGVLQARTYTAHDGLAPGVVYAVHGCRDGSVWAGTLTGAVSRIQKGRVTTFTSANGLTADAVTTIEEALDETIWVGTAGGLEAFRNGTWRRYGGEDGLPPGRVNSLAVDGDGVLWIGSASGLFYWSGARVESARNLPDSLRGEIYGLAADDIGNLWAATDRHVVSMSRSSLLGHANATAAVREFGAADGLPSTRGIRRDHAVARDSSGRIWFSLQGGLCVVNPSLPSELMPALVHVESIAVDGHPLGTGAAARYRSNRQRIVFNFIGVSLAVPGRVRYRYRLDGYDRDWSQPTESREAAYTSLPPAHYTFHVMASNSEGLWNGAPASVPFDVEPLFWQTTWFPLIVAAAVMSGIVAIYRLHLRHVTSRINLRFQERLDERTRIAQELHDTLLQGFLSASMQVHVAAERLPEDSNVKPTLNRALELMRQVIDEGRNALRGLRSTPSASLDLENAFARIQEELAVSDPASPRVAFQVIVDGERKPLHPIIRDEVYRIGREAAVNAFRHARATKIEIKLQYSARRLSVFVRDDGCGIDPKVLTTGRDGHWGLTGMRERAERIGARLHVMSSASAGTEIELDVPANIVFQKNGAHANTEMQQRVTTEKSK